MDRQEIRYHGPIRDEAAMEVRKISTSFSSTCRGDDYGHTQGWDSPAQLENFTATDALLKPLLKPGGKDGLRNLAYLHRRSVVRAVACLKTC